MNLYPSWWNTTVTIFNKYKDSNDLITWYKHIVHGCFWKYIGNKVTIGDTELESNDIICRIRKDSAFLENYQWVELQAEEKPNFFTLNKGDIIVKGEVDDEINEYQSGSRSSDVIKKYKSLQGCMIMSEYTVNTDGGRCNEHYLVKGE